MKFSMSEAWNQATAMMSANREVLLVVAGLFFFLPSLTVALSVPGLQEAMLADPENAQQAMLALYADWWWLLIVVMLLQIVGYLTLLTLLRDTGRPTVGEALRAGAKALLPAIATYFVMAFGVGLAFALLLGAAAASGSVAVAFLASMIALVGLVYLMVKFSLAGPVIAIDKVFNPFRVLLTSWRLTKGNSFRLFLFFLLLFLVYIVISIVIGIVGGALLLAAGESLGSLINGILSGVIGAAATVVAVAVVAAIHRQLSGPSAAAVSQTFE